MAAITKRLWAIVGVMVSFEPRCQGSPFPTLGMTRSATHYLEIALQCGLAAGCATELFDRRHELEGGL